MVIKEVIETLQSIDETLKRIEVILKKKQTIHLGRKEEFMDVLEDYLRQEPERPFHAKFQV